MALSKSVRVRRRKSNNNKSYMGPCVSIVRASKISFPLRRCRRNEKSPSRPAWRSFFLWLPVQRGDHIFHFCNTSAARVTKNSLYWLAVRPVAPLGVPAEHFTPPGSVKKYSRVELADPRFEARETEKSKVSKNHQF